MSELQIIPRNSYTDEQMLTMQQINYAFAAFSISHLLCNSDYYRHFMQSFAFTAYIPMVACEQQSQ